jgi:hypothetical protein
MSPTRHVSGTQNEYGRRFWRTSRQFVRDVGDVFVVVTSLVWLGVWFAYTRRVKGRFVDGFFAPLIGVGVSRKLRLKGPVNYSA